MTILGQDVYREVRPQGALREGEALHPSEKSLKTGINQLKQPQEVPETHQIL